MHALAGSVSWHWHSGAAVGKRFHALNVGMRPKWEGINRLRAFARLQTMQGFTESGYAQSPLMPDSMQRITPALFQHLNRMERTVYSLGDDHEIYPRLGIHRLDVAELLQDVTHSPQMTHDLFRFRARVSHAPDGLSSSCCCSSSLHIHRSCYSLKPRLQAEAAFVSSKRKRLKHWKPCWPPCRVRSARNRKAV